VSPPTRRAYLGIGSNLGDRAAHLQAAVDGLAATPAVRVTAVSPVYETAPVGGPPQDDYLNAVVAVETTLEARALMAAGQRLEATEHRVRRERWGPRTLDVDVLLVGDDEIHEPDLEVPHPRMTERDFVLVPLADLEPRWAERLHADHRATRHPDQARVRRTEIQLRVPE
jgi:2-amino-4-hydroxy-6-hydroxymethyldihydropteridine diphosphokinase